ncbi:Protein of unknown function, partial [Gryllus bimaculatus]
QRGGDRRRGDRACRHRNSSRSRAAAPCAVTAPVSRGVHAAQSARRRRRRAGRARAAHSQRTRVLAPVSAHVCQGRRRLFRHRAQVRNPVL